MLSHYPFLLTRYFAHLGNILDDEVLIDTLGDSKKTSNIIQEKVKVAELTQARIAKVRAGYVPVAFQGRECPNNTF